MKAKEKTNITKTIIFTILSLLLVVAIAITIFLTCFTATAAGVCYHIGLRGLSARLYVTEYARMEDINYIAKACDINIECENYSAYITNYQKMQLDSNYSDYINYINISAYNSDLDVLTKSALIDEDNYYKNMLIKALVKKDKFNTALGYVFDNLVDITAKDINYLQPDNYYVSTMLDTQSSYDWTVTEIRNNSNVLSLTYEYYINLVSYHDTLDISDIDSVYYVNLCRKILIVASDLIEIDDKVNNDIISDFDRDNIETTIDDINDKLLQYV